jgi:transposase
MSDVKTKNPVGRPKFEITDEVLLNVENLMTKGLTKEQAAGMLGVSVSTFMLQQS